MQDPGRHGLAEDAALRRHLPFPDRRTAGRRLAAQLARYGGRSDVLVLGLPRGGVPVAFEVAAALAAPLDVFSVRKLGVPGHEELALGAVASGGVRALNRGVVESFGIPRSIVDTITTNALRELDERDIRFRDGTERLPARDRVVILVDDGLATGATMRAAIEALRMMEPKRIVVAVPVAPREAAALLSREADEFVASATPQPFSAVGIWYEDFTPVSTEEVRHLLKASRQHP